MKNILVLCTGNSCRSQIAHGYLDQILINKAKIYSAGIETHGLNPNAFKVMAEAGVDISHHRSQLLSEFDDQALDYVITVCGHANESCPIFPGRESGKPPLVIHVGFDDPPKLAAGLDDEEAQLDCYRRVRDEIREFVLGIDAILG